jgi:hypothetical protein
MRHWCWWVRDEADGVVLSGDLFAAGSRRFAGSSLKVFAEGSRVERDSQTGKAARLVMMGGRSLESLGWAIAAT